jgi:3-oxoacyl-[acyl-carrier-protein] synthase III
VLEILGAGLVLPRAQKVRDLVRAAGGDPDVHDGWEQICVADAGEHPSAIAAAALAGALTEAGIEAARLDLVLGVGVSRDYPPSWSVAVEVMRLAGAADTCLGVDLSAGCIGSLIGLNTALGWLQGMGGGYAAIVVAEQWTRTIDRKDPAQKPLWNHADGGGAMVVSVGRPGASLATFHGAAFATHHAFNGLVLMKYGGTRFPAVPPGEDPFMRTIAPVPGKQIWATYAEGYGRAFAALKARFGVEPGRVICNQPSPKVVSMIAQAAGLDEGLACRTGDEYGHVGGADVMIGLRRLIDAGQIDRPLAMAASSPYAFGAGLLTPPGSPPLRAAPAATGR